MTNTVTLTYKLKDKEVKLTSGLLDTETILELAQHLQADGWYPKASGESVSDDGLTITYSVDFDYGLYNGRNNEESS